MQGSDVDLTWLCNQNQLAKRRLVSQEPLQARQKAESFGVVRADPSRQHLQELEALLPPPPPDAVQLPATPASLEPSPQSGARSRRSRCRPQPPPTKERNAATIQLTAKQPELLPEPVVAERPAVDDHSAQDTPGPDSLVEVVEAAAVQSLSRDLSEKSGQFPNDAPKPPPPPAAPPAPPAEELRDTHDTPSRLAQFRALLLLRSKAERDSLEGVKKMFVVRARVPVLKLFGSGGEVLCDVSVNNHEGLQNSRLVQGLCKTDPLLGPVVRLLKHWARSRRLADRSTGGFSTYTLVLMAVKVLQESRSASYSCKLAPEAVQELALKVQNCSSPEPLSIWMQAKNAKLCHGAQLAQAFVDFFEYFSQPAWNAGGIVRVAPPAAVPTQEEEVDTVQLDTQASTPPAPSVAPPVPPPPPLGILQVFCPLTQCDVQRSKAQEWQHMVKEIARASEILRNPELDGQAQLDELLKEPPSASKPQESQEPQAPESPDVMPIESADMLPGRITEEEAEQGFSVHGTALGFGAVPGAREGLGQSGEAPLLC